ncbi:STAS domain-containing protein [Azospirillum sp. SYSU D00513]|uniref:STAS domain-containing protein n=1 Tax=Azospirillum sp. SYSU D00513 TaxID=2812561 RepID=UPI001A96C0AB|nr:STAS domain-containing protein [Azospirillum sp. SYSU D00513]
MQFRSKTTMDVTEAYLSGRMEFTDHEKLRELINLLDNIPSRCFILDVEDLEFIDSAGLGMLLILEEEANERQIDLSIRHPRGSVLRSLMLARFHDILTVLQ